MGRDPLGFFLRVAREHGGVARIPVGPWYTYLVTDPEAVQQVLQQPEAYTKQSRGYVLLRRLLGSGLLTSEGELWRRQRRLMQPAFTPGALAGMAPAMGARIAEVARRWEGLAERRETVDVLEEMSTLTRRVVSDTLFGADLGEADRVVGEALPVLLKETNDRVYAPVVLPEWVPTPGNRRFRRARDAIRAVVDEILARRRREGGERPDLLGRLLAVRDPETGEGMDDAQLRDEVLTLYLAGHETTAAALTWTWWLLARHPETATALAEEARVLLGDRPAGYEDLPGLTWTGQVVDESLRLYPPVWAISRAAAGDGELDGFRIPRGALVVLSPWVTHRLDEHWEDPERFDPGRFEPARRKGRHRCAWFPFGAGPHQCLGMGYARLEVILAVETLTARFRVEPLAGVQARPRTMITIHPEGGLPARLVRRG